MREIYCESRNNTAIACLSWGKKNRLRHTGLSHQSLRLRSSQGICEARKQGIIHSPWPLCLCERLIRIYNLNWKEKNHGICKQSNAPGESHPWAEDDSNNRRQECPGIPAAKQIFFLIVFLLLKKHRWHVPLFLVSWIDLFVSFIKG